MEALEWACLAVAVLVGVLVSFSHIAREVLCGLNCWLASIYMAFSAGMRYADAARRLAP